MVHYEDGGLEEIPVLYGDDDSRLVDHQEPAGGGRGKVAWQGDNATAKSYGHRLRPLSGPGRIRQPEKTVTEIDFVKGDDPTTSPICIALTLEPK